MLLLTPLEFPRSEVCLLSQASLLVATLFLVVGIHTKSVAFQLLNLEAHK